MKYLESLKSSIMITRKTLFVMYEILFMKIMKVLIKLGDILISFPIVICSEWKSKQNIPEITDDLLLIPATVLARNIREKSVKCETLINAFITRIKEVNPILNAVVEERFSAAIQEARNVDQIVTKGFHSLRTLERDYPLLGVPITVKESIAVSNMSHNAGLICSRQKANKDADVITKIKDAGAIVLAVTNTPELCLDWECYNKVTGTTSNPYDNRRTTGGSSGGEAALIGSGASVVGIGSDTLGSLRLPAHFCGIFSHKPTPCTVSIEGHFPTAEDTKLWQKVFTLGPMSRYAVDLSLILDVMCKDEVKDSLNLDRKADFSELTIFYMESWEHELTHPVIPEITEAIHKTVRYFRKKYNTQVQKWQHAELSKLAENSLASLIQMKGIDNIFEKDPQRSLIVELVRFCIGLSNHTFFSIAYLFLHRHLPIYNIEKIRENIQNTEQSILKYLGNNGVLICPTFPLDATYHHGLFTKSYNNIYMSTFNSLGLPVTVCPMGLSKKGLPIGLQIVGRPYSDHLTIAIAQEMEIAFGGWKKPC